jgi:hypothetical protein
MGISHIIAPAQIQEFAEEFANTFIGLEGKN